MRVFFGVGLERDLERSPFQTRLAFLGTVSCGDFDFLGTADGSVGDGVADVVMGRSEMAFELSDAKDGSVVGVGDALQDIMDVAFAIEDMNQSRALKGRQLVEGGFGGFDALEPFGAFLLLDGFLLSQGCGRRALDGAAPKLLMELATDQSIGLNGDGGMEVKAEGIGVIEFPESSSLGEGGVIDGGGILNGEDGFLSSAQVQGGIDEGLEAGIGLDALVFEESIEGLGLAGFSAGLGKGIEGFVGEGFENEAEASIESFVGEVGLGGDEGSPVFGGISQGKIGSGHPCLSVRPSWFSERMVRRDRVKRQAPLVKNCA